MLFEYSFALFELLGFRSPRSVSYVRGTIAYLLSLTAAMSVTKMQMPKCKTTILTRAVILIAALALLNGALWIVTALCFSDRLLSLALLAWTLGLRHGLDVSKEEDAAIVSLTHPTRAITSVSLMTIFDKTHLKSQHQSIILLENSLLEMAFIQ